MPTERARLAILGAGSWGSTLAWLLSGAGRQVTLYTRDASKAARIRRKGVISEPVSVRFNESIQVTSDLKEALSKADVIIFCSTSQTLRSLALRSKEALEQRGTLHDSDSLPILISAVKGLELHTYKRMSEILEEVLPGFPVCSLSGPNLADEILKKLPAASVVAGTESSRLEKAQSVLSVSGFRVYTNNDIVGVELGGALKNIIAIAAGVSDGLSLGANARAALLTRGLAEMTRLAGRLGARPSTLAGLAGMGDLFATCSASSSRNHRLGYALAKGKNLEDALLELGAVAEGVTTTYAVCEFSQSVGLELPIAEQVQATLSGKTTPEGAIMTLMTRPLSSE